MITENLIIGMKVKNYKELCSLLEIIPCKGGKSRQLQIKDIERYFSYEKEGQKFIIKEVFKIPKPKDNLLINGNNSKYIEEIRDVLTSYLYENKGSNAKVLLSFSKLVGILGLANNTYTIANTRKRELSDILNVELKAVYYFYNNTRSTFKGIVERALDNLQKRSVIFYNKKIMIVENTGEYNKNTKQPLLKYREALPDEVSMILDAQKGALEYLGLEDFQGLFFAGSSKYKEFMKLVKEELPKDWQFFFNVYELIVGEKAIKIEYEHMVKRRLELNEKSIEKVTALLKVVNKDNPEQILIDKLIDLNNYDELLDNEILTLCKTKKLDKKKRTKKNNDVLMEMAFKKLELEEDNIITNKEDDFVSKYDYYNYSHEIKNRKAAEVYSFEEFDNIF